MYAVIRLYSSVNYLRQVLAMMWLVVVICLYLSLWQLELFSCFLFLGEFTILIFFYCLFLHLRASASQGTVAGSYKLTTVSLFGLLFGSFLWLALWCFNADAVGGSSILYIDLYRRASDFILNDLVSLYYFFVHSNVAIHSIIGLMLFLLTLCLFLVVSLYAGLNVARKQAYKGTQSRLFTTRGYYEQTAMFSQKYFTQENTEDQRSDKSGINKNV